MNKAEKKFRLTAIIAILVLLIVLLGVINIVSFTMATTDADEITQRIADQNGQLDGSASAEPAPSGDPGPGGWNNNRSFFPGGGPQVGFFGPTGPIAADTEASIRYFTAKFTEDGQFMGMEAFAMSAVTEEEAQEWAGTLLKEDTGWTNGPYRYRVYENNSLTYVTVIDQSRELLASYRILIISLVGGILCLIIAYFVLKYVGRRLFAPLEEADEKQKKFVAGANRELRLPLTIVNADTELIEREHGPDDHTRSIHRQVRKMEELVSRIETLSIFNEPESERYDVPLSELLRASLDEAAERFQARSLTVSADIAPDVHLIASAESMKRMVDELIDNALRYASGEVSFRLFRESERIVLQTSNGTALPDGSYDNVFDRFTTLDNAPEDATGLGLAAVKEIVKAHDGRASARVANGVFTVRIAL